MSQCDQDKFVNETFFKNKKGGVFVEIGAYNGIHLSNSYFFEKELEWQGLCVEPIPEAFEELIKNRSCICVQGCVAAESGIVDFLRLTGVSTLLSGVVDKYDPKHLERIDREQSLFPEEVFKNIIQVNCYTLNDLLEKNKFYNVDYLSIDTEGGELSILKSIDFQKFHIEIIDVENNYDDPATRLFLESVGYEFVTKLKQDEIYKRKSLN